MKQLKWISGAAALLILGACSNDDVPSGGENTETVPAGYISVNLQLPTDIGTRALNDNFDDGVASEYNVNEGVLVLFQGEADGAEADATFVGAYDLEFPKDGSQDNTQDGNVTISYNRIVKVEDKDISSVPKLYGLVLANYSQAGITFTKQSGTGVLTLGDAVCGEDTKFSTFFTTVSSLSFTDVTDNGNVAESIFMTNSPLSDKKGGDDDPTADTKVMTLVDFTGKVKATEEEAKANPAGTIYLERAVAKVTMSKFLGAETIGDGIPSGISVNGQNLVVSAVEWAIGNEEKTSFYVRNVAGLDWSLHTASTNLGVQYRMVGSKGVLKNIKDSEDPNAERLYRPYWCVDPRYSNVAPGSNEYVEPTMEDAALRTPISWGKDQVFYCHENTFDVAHMNYANTTRVGIWVTFKWGDNTEAVTFYTLGADKNTIYFDDDKEVNPLVNVAMDVISKNDEVKNAWNAALDKTGTGSISKTMEECLEIKSNVTEAGVLVIESIDFKEEQGIYIDNKKPVFDFSNIISTINGDYKFNEYKDGKAFYEVRIKHFGDDLTPWDIEGSAVTIDKAYPEGADRDNKYLGRYGMVRNNWYDLNIKSLNKLGDPRDPATWEDSWEKWKDTPDDNRDQYISVNINVLSWAKRLQEHEF